MPDLNFQVEGVQVVANAATPLLAFKLHLSSANPEQVIHTVALRCQIQLEVTRRKYSAEDQERLLDLFGEPSRWGQTLRSLLWTHANLVVPSFTGSTLVDLPVPCSFDFNVAATKYFEGLETYYPNSAWLSLRKDVFDQLYQYKVTHGIPTWEEVLERIIPQPEGETVIR